MGTQGARRRLSAVLSADAVGYSRLMSRDDEGALRLLTAQRAALAGRVRQHGGRVVDDVGDNLLAEFPSVVDAVECALEAQRALGERNAGIVEAERMAFRVGVHLGDVLVDGERIYGDGVNIAARLQGLADPGGISISHTVYEQVRSRYAHVCEDRGEQRLKNIDHPVHAYRLHVRRDSEGEPSLTVPGFGGRPALAVLAFENLSGDPEQEYFADGIAEDLITRLSCFGSMPVIARNSSFVYKGKAVAVKQVSNDLGVRYLVEGSVRKVGKRVRISAKLIDATTEHHLWAERYDRELEDIFTVQDEITETIAQAVTPVLVGAERRRVLFKAPASLDAWDCLQRAFVHFFKLTKEGNCEVAALGRRSIELDPRYAPAYSLLAASHLFDVHNQWSDDPVASLAEAMRRAEQGLELDRGNPTCHEALGWACIFLQQNERARAAFERALELNPSFTCAYWGLGVVLYSLGLADDAVAMIEKAIRLSPHEPTKYLFFHNLGLAHFLAGRYEEAAANASRSLVERPEQPATYRLLAASCGHLGRIAEAREALAQLDRLAPDFELETFRALNEVVAEPMVEGWRKAGWDS